MQAIVSASTASAHKGLVPADKMLSINDVNQIKIAIGGEKFFPALIDEIKKVDKQVLIQTFVWDRNTQFVKDLNNTLREIGEEKLKTNANSTIHVFVLVDEISKSGQRFYRPHKKPQVWPHDAKSMGFEDLPPNIKVHIGVHHHKSVRSTHAKTVIIDNDKFFITGANIQPSNYGANANFDAGVIFKGEIAESAFYDFKRMWENRSNKNEENINPAFEPVKQQQAIANAASVLLTASRARRISPHVIFALTSASLPKDPVNNSIKTALENAQNIVRIGVPNLNAPYCIKALANFINKRNGTVQILLSHDFNDQREFFYGGTNDYALNHLIKAVNADKTDNLQLRWYARDNHLQKIHMKLLTIDDELTIFGSADLDLISLLNCHETNIVIDHAEFTKNIVENIYKPAFNQSIPVTSDNLSKDFFKPFSLTT